MLTSGLRLLLLITGIRGNKMEYIQDAEKELRQRIKEFILALIATNNQEAVSLAMEMFSIDAEDIKRWQKQ